MRALAWVVADGAWRLRRWAGAAVAAGLLGLGLQLAAFGMVFRYIRAVEHNRWIAWPGLRGPARDLPALLWATAGGAALCWLGGAVAVYAARVLPLRMRRAYQEFCWARAVPLLWRLPLPDAPQANRWVAQGLAGRVIGKGARAAGRLLAAAMNALLPLGRLAACVVVLLWIHWPMTLLLLGLAAAGLLFQTRYNRAAGGLSMRMERGASSAGKALRSLLAGGGATADVAAAALRDNEAARQWDALIGRLELRERAALAMNILGAAALLIVMAVVSGGTRTGALEWTLVVAYLAALKYFIANLGLIGSVLTSVGRFLPQVVRYQEFVMEIERAEPSAADGERPARLKLERADGGPPVDWGGAGRRWVAAGAAGAREIACRLQLAADGRPRIAVLPAPERAADGERLRTAAEAAAVVVADEAWARAGAALAAAAQAAAVFLVCRRLPPEEAAAEEEAVVAEAEGGLRACTVGWLRERVERWGQAPGGGGWEDEDDEEDDEDD